MNTPAVQPTAQRHMPTIKKIPKTVEILHVVQETVSTIQEIQKIVELAFMDEVVDVPCVLKSDQLRFLLAA